MGLARAQEELFRRYRLDGWWGQTTVGDLVAVLASERPDDPAVITPSARLSWSRYHEASLLLSRVVHGVGLGRGERVAVLLDDGPSPHVVYVANQRAGLVTVGIGARAGEREIATLIDKTGAKALLTHSVHRGFEAPELFERLRRSAPSLQHHIVVPKFEDVSGTGAVGVDGEPAPDPAVEPHDPLGPDELFMINSTSGTTGLPKCVMHNENSKLYMAQQAVRCGELISGNEVIMGAAPIPFGFGMFTTHFLTALLGVPAVVTERFDPELTCRLIESESATVLIAVSSQFKMLLNAGLGERFDGSSLRVMFTGGEAIPFATAAQFEKRTGAKLLNFYGSNESGMATGTKTTDPQELRLGTGGTYLPGTDLVLFDDEGQITTSGRGQPASRGPAVCLGYFGDPAANDELFTEDGYVLHADICTIDQGGYLRVVGRKSDIIIRGGKNLSAAVVEEQVNGHPSVAIAAAVPVADPVLGERVCAFVELHPGTTLTFGELIEFLETEGYSKETFPEYLSVVPQLPRSSGGKIAKGELLREAERISRAT
ncbi:MAG: class I adenylate-forming enzyme family protein [Acidimicrobiales bacterium]